MCVTIQYGGRLGNNMLQYAAGHIFARKHGFYIETPASYGNDYHWPTPYSHFHNDFGKHFNVNTNTGTRFFKEPEYPVVRICNENLLDFLNAPYVPDAHYVFDDWFQTTGFVLNYRKEIVQTYYPIYLLRDPDELFVSVRMGDITGWTATLPYEYYENTIKSVRFSKGYISSDSMEHPWVEQLSKKFNLELYHQKDPLVKLSFVKDFNQIILSEGTYCWWMGALSKADTVICNNRHFNNKVIWHGNIFVYPEWIKMAYDIT